MSQIRKLRRSVARAGGPDLRTPVRSAGVARVLDETRVGAINAYCCDDCGGYTVTRDVDPGVTPMFLACRADGQEDSGCRGRAVSLGYPKGPPPEWLPEVAWEWYAPLQGDPLLVHPEMRDHAQRGGLFLRPVR